MPASHTSNRRPITVQMGPLFDRQPPYAMEAEMALLGSIILDWQVTADVIELLAGPEDFYKPTHAAIYEVLLELYEEHQSIDMVQINQKLTDRKQLEAVGGLEYLLDLVDGVPSATDAHLYARIVRDKALIRRLIEASGEVLHACYHDDQASAEQLIERAEAAVFDLAQNRGDDHMDVLGDLAAEFDARLDALEGSPITGIETGFLELDEMTNGLQRSELVIIAARPSLGKTAFALNIAEHITAVNRVPAAFFSLEMSREQLTQRLLSSRSGLDSKRVSRNLLNEPERREFKAAVQATRHTPLYIDDTPGLTLMALRARARRMVQKHQVQAIFIDYLQLMSAPGNSADGRQNEVSAMSRGVKALARELNVPVVCLSQLNRAAEQREGHRPRMSDLRDSGSIEQDADVVMMLHRDDYYHRGEPEYVDNHEAEVLITKQRNGPTGVVRLHFDGGTTRFRNLARTSEQRMAF